MGPDVRDEGEKSKMAPRSVAITAEKRGGFIIINKLERRVILECGLTEHTLYTA